MTARTLVLVDAGMVAGYRRADLSLAQLHQALVHLHRQHPEVHVAVIGDPSLKWDLSAEEQPLFEGDIVAKAVVCTPAGAYAGTGGFLEQAAARAKGLGYEVVAFTARAIPGVPLGRLRADGARWIWDLDGTTTIDADEAKAKAASAASAGGRRRARRR